MIGGYGEKYNAQGHYGHENSTEELDAEIRKELGEYIPDQERRDLGDNTLHIDQGVNPGIGIGALFGGGKGGGGFGAQSGGGGSTSFEFGIKETRNSSDQILVNGSPEQAIQALESNGYSKSLSQDGSVSILSNGFKIYRFYGASTSAGVPSASMTYVGDKKPSVKLRFDGE